MRRARAAVAGADAAEQAPAQIGSHAERPDWLSAAGRPAFEELRNVMLLLGLRVSGVRRALFEMGPPLGDYLRPEIARDLFHVSGAMEDLTEAVGEIEKGLDTLRTTLHSLEELVVAPRRGTRLAELARHADSLAQHHTRPLGGVRWRLPDGDPSVAMQRTVAIAVLGTALSLLGLRLAATAPGHPIEVDCRDDGHACAMWFESALHVVDVEECARALAQMFGDDAPVNILVRGSALVLELPLVTRR